MPDNEDLKAKMREALERKQASDRGVPDGRPGEGEGPRLRGRRGSAQDAPPEGGRRRLLSLRMVSPAVSKATRRGMSPRAWVRTG